MSIDKKISYVADMVKRYDRDRYLTALFAPSAIREKLLTLYAFNAEVARIRETVTEPMIGQMRLQWWRDVITAVSEGKGAPKGHPVAEPLAVLVESQTLSLGNFLSLLEAREQDMSEDPPKTMGELVGYCRGSSASLSRLALEVMEVKDASTLESAESVATAWALTGIARAARHLALSGRTMLPSDAMAAKGLEIQDLQHPDKAGRSADIIRGICNEARMLLTAARTHRKKIDLRALPVLLPATLAESYLNTLARVKYQIYDPRQLRERPAILRLSWNAWLKRF
jgi:NADH dehydrogenase [ubiquinone] 1 alpha subcomplex assembly factor 6